MNAYKTLLLTAPALFAQSSFGNHFFSVGKTATAPMIDGKEDACYRKTMEISGLTSPSTMLYANDQTTVKFCYDKNNLYGFIQCQQKDADKMALPGKMAKDNEKIWQGNAVELFFLCADNKMRHFMIDMVGNVYDATADEDEALQWNMNPKWNSGIRVATSRNANQWNVEFAIPLKDIPGKKFQFNIARDTGKSGTCSTLVRKENDNWWHGVKDFSALQFVEDTIPGFQFRELPQMFADSKCSIQLQSKNDASIFTLTVQNKKIKPVQKENLLTWNYKPDFIKGKKQDVAFSVTKNGKELYRFEYEVPTARVKLIPANLTNNLIYLNSSIKLAGRLSWECRHNYTDALTSMGGRVYKPSTIIFEVPEGITVQGGKEVKKLKKNGKNYSVFEKKEPYLYNSKHYFSSFLDTTLPAGSKGSFTYSLIYPDGVQPPQSVDFVVLQIPLVKAPKRFITGHYNTWPDLARAKELAKTGVNAVGVRGYNKADIEKARTLKKAGFFLRRSESWWPGYANGFEGWKEWTRQDRSARARDIDGFYIPLGNSFQLSPTYRGKHFVNDIKKDAAFCREAGIDWFVFDMEGYIMPHGERADFCDRTLKEFETYFAKNFKGKKYISPKVFESNVNKYPDYHKIWVDFKCEMFGMLMVDMKALLEKEINKDLPAGTPRRKVKFTEWSLNAIQTLEGRNRCLRGPRFFAAFDHIELDMYSSIDRNLREIEMKRAEFKREFPNNTLNVIVTPASRRLAANNGSYYSTTAPELPDERKYMMMEAVTMNVKGIYSFYWHIIDLDYIRQFAEGVQIISRMEDVIMDGKYFDLTCNYPADMAFDEIIMGKKQHLKNQKRVFTRGVTLGNKTIISVSEYRTLADMKVVVNYAPQYNVRMTDLETGKDLGILKAGEKLKVHLQENGRRCKLLLLEKR